MYLETVGALLVLSGARWRPSTWRLKGGCHRGRRPSELVMLMGSDAALSFIFFLFFLFFCVRGHSAIDRAACVLLTVEE